MYFVLRRLFRVRTEMVKLDGHSNYDEQLSRYKPNYSISDQFCIQRLHERPYTNFKTLSTKV